MKNYIKKILFLVVIILLFPAMIGINRNDMERRINFSGYKWIVKGSNERLFPGPNYFSNSSDLVYVDKEGLHLSIKKIEKKAFCTEIRSEKSFGYGTYVFTIKSDFKDFNSTAVLGLFTYDYDKPPYYNEIDFEFSKWKQYDNVMAQFVTQPYDKEGHMTRFDFNRQGEFTMSFEWLKDSIKFKIWNGSNSNPVKNEIIKEWLYTSNIPIPANEKVHLNFWLFRNEMQNLNDLEVVVKNFKFIKPEKSK